MENIFLFHYRSFVRGHLKTLLAYKNIRRDLEAIGGPLTVVGKKRSDFGDAAEQGEKDKWFGIQTSCHGQEGQETKSCLFFKIMPFFPRMMGVFEGPDFPKSFPVHISTHPQLP